MTPLEELQAAHKRLSELRAASSQGHWWVTASRDFRVEIGFGEMGWDVIADGDVECSRLPVSEHDADLIVTLHRTIDAQLVLIRGAIAGATPYAVGGSTDGAASYHPGTIDRNLLDLARAINGEAS